LAEAERLRAGLAADRDEALAAVTAAGEARHRVDQELVRARERAEAEAALRVRADAELDRLRTELEGLRARGTEELRALVAAAVRDAAPPDQTLSASNWSFRPVP